MSYINGIQSNGGPPASTDLIIIGPAGTTNARTVTVQQLRLAANSGNKPTVTGAKGGNAALTSLIAALAALGLVTDTTT